MITLYFILMIAFLIFGLKMSKISMLKESRYELSPRLILVISFFMYSVAMPISRLFFDSAGMTYDIEYMVAQALGALGILTGLFIQYKYLKFTRNRKEKPAPIKFLRTPALICMTMALAVVMFSALNALGWNFSAILNPYGFESTLMTGNEERSLFGAILELIAISSILLSFVGAYKINNKTIIFIALSFAAVFSMFFLLRGSRNIAGMMLIPLVCVYFSCKPIKIKKLLLSCLLLYFLIYTVGVVRNIGFAQVGNIPIELRMFDPLAQEFGTNLSVFAKWKEIEQNDPLLLGKSYTVGILYNLVPISLWPDRPPGAAIKFSMDFFGVSHYKELTEGLGFSPIVEVLINFGYIGIVPVFAMFAMLITVLESWFWTKGAWGIASFAFMIPMVVNWNRIDMATTAKMFIIFLVISKLLAVVLFPSRNMLFRIRLISRSQQTGAV